MKDCIVCGDSESEDLQLRRAACDDHFLCDPCLEDAFRLAMRDEKHYHPRCCNDEASVLLIEDYEQYLPFELAFEYRVKEVEYSVQPRFRTYCSNSNCERFIHRDNYINSESGEQAHCDACGTLTCVKCKALVADRKWKDPRGHECKVLEEDEQFKEVVAKKGYQECYNCGSTIELAEACNHISCECGCDFCYVCAEPWEGIHGCPQYGQPIYDEEGYNQDGFHRETGLDREGRTRIQARDEDGTDEEEEDADREDDEDDEDEDDGEITQDEINLLNLGLTAEERRLAMELQRFQDGDFAPETEDDETSSDHDTNTETNTETDPEGEEEAEDEENDDVSTERHDGTSEAFTVPNSASLDPDSEWEDLEGEVVSIVSANQQFSESDDASAEPNSERDDYSDDDEELEDEEDSMNSESQQFSQSVDPSVGANSMSVDPGSGWGYSDNVEEEEGSTGTITPGRYLPPFPHYSSDGTAGLNGEELPGDSVNNPIPIRSSSVEPEYTERDRYDMPGAWISSSADPRSIIHDDVEMEDADAAEAPSPHTGGVIIEADSPDDDEYL